MRAKEAVVPDRGPMTAEPGAVTSDTSADGNLKRESHSMTVGIRRILSSFFKLLWRFISVRWTAHMVEFAATADDVETSYAPPEMIKSLRRSETIP